MKKHKELERLEDLRQVMGKHFYNIYNLAEEAVNLAFRSGFSHAGKENKPETLRGFPNIGGDSGLYPDGGMSLQQWYAGLAMQALVRDNDKIHASLVAKRAFEIAEAMVQEGEK